VIQCHTTVTRPQANSASLRYSQLPYAAKPTSSRVDTVTISECSQTLTKHRKFHVEPANQLWNAMCCWNQVQLTYNSQRPGRALNRSNSKATNDDHNSTGTRCQSIRAGKNRRIFSVKITTDRKLTHCKIRQADTRSFSTRNEQWLLPLTTNLTISSAAFSRHLDLRHTNVNNATKSEFWRKNLQLYKPHEVATHVTAPSLMFIHRYLHYG
jgi:hypothetical protein